MMAHQIGVVAAAASGANSLAQSEDEEGEERSRRWGSRKEGDPRGRGGNNVMQ